MLEEARKTAIYFSKEMNDHKPTYIYRRDDTRELVVSLNRKERTQDGVLLQFVEEVIACESCSNLAKWSVQDFTAYVSPGDKVAERRPLGNPHFFCNEHKRESFIEVVNI